MPLPDVDPVIEFFKRKVDRAALRRNLQLSFQERLEQLEEVSLRELPPKRQPPSPDQPWQPVSDCGPNRTSDPIIELYKRDVDRTLLRENLKLTQEARFDQLSSMAKFVDELHRNGVKRRTAP